jgi:hypothetical protein
MWMYVHKHYLDDFDFFHIGGDHMWVVVETFKYALSHENTSVPLYLGAPFIKGTLLKRMFCGGGAERLFDWWLVKSGMPLVVVQMLWVVRKIWSSRVAYDGILPPAKIVWMKEMSLGTIPTIRRFMPNGTHNNDPIYVGKIYLRIIT